VGRQATEKTLKIRNYILTNVENVPQHIAPITARAFNISRQSVGKHLRWLIDNNYLEAYGKTKARTYSLKMLIDKRFTLDVTEDMQEDIVWREYVRPYLKDTKKNVYNICDTGFSEMLNNVIDHSGALNVTILIQRNPISITIAVIDNGLGIFNKIQKDFNLNDPRHALLELSKGKLTSDVKNHSGQGIFFTSKMFDYFSILSGELYFARTNAKQDWLIETETREKHVGTHITMTVSPDAEQTPKEIYDRYGDEHNDYGFVKTHVPIMLAKYDDDQLVSRSAAKRLLARFDKFEEVWLDFKNVSTIGQAFADEVFRVFFAKHPKIKICVSSANKEVTKMIERAKIPVSEIDKDQLGLF